ncbi:pre-mRNA cleavage and polyadenylation factor (CPF) complex subunit [Exophiala dermatitidis]|uniref:Polyadenylation factor subunit 2 n=1 Tax=Exophiala dermatitidis TaxID=5970 RepID=A0AAN6EVM6_EXODE|nr:pre-mRNA cleavage and polyadenylation factor (CPF) complex subunit [Exophiala dermatitidis]KAJ4515875.1 pre-mRNA cleavage and polyadenylation factor (CPF) complex subunit [Exophiala dermatitidis]KAJ4518718.1 pre-mRNA cleavage and polyadenylation factor (CPF) complex subunit [Exophiala dermatitidis]KAJ4534232.1 pre-mRNA cleavage and polyadenylation factor (CPF) complex subunit [Exophiala dermatitidis]KAJ4545873.1 pre-mRNA cleavage and polyadenylation factor (CPF) complex subunit [Exophiala de
MANHYDDQGEGGLLRRRRPRPITDYGSSMVQWMSHRKPAYKGSYHYEQERPSQSYVIDMLPPAARRDAPAESIPVRHLHTSLGKSKKPVTVVRWMPEGRRLLAGVHNGEFMLWNGMSFNFETVTAMGSSSLRAAEWSNRKDWLVAANDEGTVYYLQPTLNNPHQFKGHDAPIRDIAFAPSDTKFVTASDDNTLKIWDFTSSTNESTFKEHGWDVKACDWHPTKGLVVSGSKDHSVRLWDPRTTRNLTTLHGHKNAITATVFSRLRDQLLATAGRDGQIRIFDLRLMRDVAILRGHEKGVTTLSWHPIHPSLISTGGDDGSLHTYLLTEPNTPSGISSITTSPYASSDPRSAPAQSIYPAHRIPHAHESSIWSLDWHPLGHILASGSNDHYTRFWSRAQPGLTTCFKDQFHLGEEGAEAQGTWDRKFGRRQAREQEEQEAEDEAEGLEDQGTSDAAAAAAVGGGFSIPGLPGLPGLSGPNMNGTSTTQQQQQQQQQQISSGGGPAGITNIPPPPLSLMPGLAAAAAAAASGRPQGQQPPPFPPVPGMDAESLQRLLAMSQQQQSHQPQGQQHLQGLPQGIDFSNLNLPAGLQVPRPSGGGLPGLDFSGGGGGGGSIPGLGGAGAGAGASTNGAGAGGSGSGSGGSGSVRRRAPLPSQQDGFKAEQARGNYRVAR